MGGAPGGGLGNMFNDPQMIQKLANNPKTRSLLADQQFMQKLQRLKNNPNDIGTEMQDPRFLQVMSVLLGIDMSFGGKDGAGMPDLSGSKEAEEDVPMPDARPAPEMPSEPTKAPEKPSEPEPEAEPEADDEEAVAKKKAKEQAETEKRHGTENYKKRQFDAAIEHYDKAWSLHKDITYLTNKSAALFEKGDFQESINTCKTAIEEGREVLADFKIIAKYISLSFLIVSLYLQGSGLLAELVHRTRNSVTFRRLSQITKNPSLSTVLLISLINSAPRRRPRLKLKKTHTSILKRLRKHESLVARSSRMQTGPVLWKPTPR